MVQLSLIEKRWGTTIPKSSFHDNFDGDSLDEMWSTTIDGTGSVAAGDSVDGGILLTTGTTTSDDVILHFNNIRQYDPAGSTIIFRCKRNGTPEFLRVGFNGGNTSSFLHTRHWMNDTSDTFKKMVTSAASSTTVDSSIAVDTNMTTYQIQSNSTATSGSINGILEAVSTTNLPTNDSQPWIHFRTRTTAAKTANIIFMEAYNT